MIQPRLLAYVLHSEIGRTQFKNNEYGGTKQGLGLGDVKSVFLPVPTLKEQSEICTYLDEEVKQFTAAITNLEREIALLREYRTRLTADVVTGKLDVRREKSEEGRVKSEEGRVKGEEGRVKGEGDWGKEDEAEALETEEGGEDE